MGFFVEAKQSDITNLVHPIEKMLQPPIPVSVFFSKIFPCDLMNR